MWGLQQTVPPGTEPVSLDEAKQYLRVDQNAEDDLIGQLISAARRRVERGSYRQLVTATWLLTLDSFFDLEPRARWTLQSVPGQEDLIPQLRGVGIFSAGNVIRLPKTPLVSVVSIYYTAADGTQQLLDPSAYVIDAVSEPGRVAPAYSTFWPITLRQIQAVRITFTAGYGSDPSTVHQEVKLAIKRIVGLYYQNRDLGAGGRALDAQAMEAAIDAVIFGFWTGEV